MALGNTVVVILEIVINIVLFYISAAIMCSIMFRREVKKWSWLNLIMATVAALIWVFRLNIPLGNAADITFGIVIFLVCWLLWVMAGGISERRSVYATVGTFLLWFLFSWILMIIFGAFNIENINNFPTLLNYFT
jgi:hypothetical protein